MGVGVEDVVVCEVLAWVPVFLFLERFLREDVMLDEPSPGSIPVLSTVTDGGLFVLPGVLF